MDFFFKKNKVFKNAVTTPGSKPIKNGSITLEINNIDAEKKDVYLGPNGVGKSFLWQSIAYLACLYKKVPIRKQYEVIQRLADSEIGDVVDGEQATTICIKSSYSPHSLNILKKGEINYNKYYVANLGEKAKELLKEYTITYYSNSPYISCISFFNKDCSSLSSKDINYEFWAIYKSNEFKLSNFDNLGIKIWVNFSVSESKLSKFINESYIEEKKKDILDKYDNCFAYVPIKDINESFEFLKKNFSESPIYKKYCEFEEGNIKFPDKAIKTDKLQLHDFILLLLIHEHNTTYNYKLQINNIDIDLVNSGTKCDFVFKALCLLNPNQNKQILIIDEPENSLHMNRQENLSKYIPKDFKLILITHSPSFVLNLLDEGFNNHNLYIMTKIEEKDDTQPDGKVEKTIIDLQTLNYASLDDIAAEYFGYHPTINEWEKKNPKNNFTEKNFISINDFYEKLHTFKKTKA